MSESTYDELAGVVDLFGALTRAELAAALDELAFKQRRETDAEALSGAVEDAIEAYYLVAYDVAEAGGDEGGTGDGGADEGAELLTAGPLAFPTLPPRAEDLPHILDYPVRSVPRDDIAEQVVERLRGEAARAVDEGDADRMRRLLDVTYDLEAWANVDVSAVRRRLDDALDEEGQA